MSKFLFRFLLLKVGRPRCARSIRFASRAARWTPFDTDEEAEDGRVPAPARITSVRPSARGKKQEESTSSGQDNITTYVQTKKR